MSNIQEKQSFSLRLKQALTQAGYPVSPTYLSREFNNRYSGQPISVQSANNWLLGKAIPNQDKLLILSVWLNISSQWLRFGDEVNQQDNLSDSAISKTDLELIVKFKKLSFSQKQILDSIIEEFIKN